MNEFQIQQLLNVLMELMATCERIATALEQLAGVKTESR